MGVTKWLTQACTIPPPHGWFLCCHLRHEKVVVDTAIVADGAVVKRLAAPMDKPRSETVCSEGEMQSSAGGERTNGAGGGRDADEALSAADVATTAALAARLSA
jgi:hypothetical protein